MCNFNKCIFEQLYEKINLKKPKRVKLMHINFTIKVTILISERKILNYCKIMIEVNLTFSIKLDSLFTSCVSFCRFASTVSCPAGEMPKKPGQKSERQKILKVFKAV